MYASLDGVDLVLSGSRPGQRILIQTDHRSFDEINNTPDLSALFALIRMINPHRMIENDEAPLICYLFGQSSPPEFLRLIIETAGGTVLENIDEVDSLIELDFGPKFPLPELDELLHEHLNNLAKWTVKECGQALTLSGLQECEKVLLPQDTSLESDYWARVLKLGAITGELIRQNTRGKWVLTQTGTLPLGLVTQYQGEEAVVNPMGKAIKYFEQGEEGDEQLPSRLAELLLSNT